MRKSLIVPVVAAFAALGCSSSSKGGDDGGVSTDPGNCTVITVAKLSSVGVAGWLEGAAVVADGSDSTQRTLRVELDEPHGSKLAPGTFDLSKEQDYAGAAHAVVVFEDGDDPTTASRVFFQASGSMQLDVVSSPPTAQSKGSISGVKLVESTIDPDTYDSTPVQDGECVFVTSAAWDTTVASGASCTRVDDCGNPNKVCDPVTKTCVNSQCDGAANACPTGKTCVVQGADSTAGACYASCSPLTSASACTGDAECVSIQFDQSLGICKPRGVGVQGDECQIDDVSTHCAAGMVCSPEEAGNLCRSQCDYWGTPSCPSGQHCFLGSVCSDAPIDPAAVDAQCDGSSGEGTSCGLTGTDAIDAICVSETIDTSGDVANVCRKTCRKSVATDCPSGEECDDYYDTVGVCRPPV